ncbi:hypothetical protein [Streptomyces sp. NRRL WC-3742]|uniref:galactose-binding domain-containing protein n=1 Tax=Streptomyces sp. NRRL WC-3742 TaxID=1463934 RepID=UPI003B6407F6
MCPSAPPTATPNGTWSAGTCTHTADDANQAWWQVDLGTSTDIGQVWLYNRTDSPWGLRLSNLWATASDSEFTSGDLTVAHRARSDRGLAELDLSGCLLWCLRDSAEQELGRSFLRRRTPSNQRSEESVEMLELGHPLFCGLGHATDSPPPTCHRFSGCVWVRARRQPPSSS